MEIVICSLSLTFWFFILFFLYFSFFKNFKKEPTAEEKINKEALRILKTDEKVNIIIGMIVDLESNKDDEKSKVKAKILKTKLKLMISNPVVREAIMRIKKIKNNA